MALKPSNVQHHQNGYHQIAGNHQLLPLVVGMRGQELLLDHQTGSHLGDLQE